MKFRFFWKEIRNIDSGKVNKVPWPFSAWKYHCFRCWLHQKGILKYDA